MAKSLEETLKDLRAGGYSEGGIRNWLVNKGFQSAKVDKAMALHTASLAVCSAKDSSATVLRTLYGEDDAKQLLKAAKSAGFANSTRSGQKVTVSGFSGNGPDEALAWRELKKRFGPLHVEVYTIGRDTKIATDRRSRLHRALDAVMDSCGTRAKDAEPTLAQLTKKIESLKNKEDAARGRVGLAVEARKRLRGQSGRLQSPREMKARHALSDIQSELMSAELALRNLTQ